MEGMLFNLCKGTHSRGLTLLVVCLQPVAEVDLRALDARPAVKLHFLLGWLLIEVEAAGCCDDASQGTNGTQNGHKDAQDEDDPGSPEVVAPHAGPLDHQEYQRRAARTQHAVSPLRVSLPGHAVKDVGLSRMPELALDALFGQRSP